VHAEACDLRLAILDLAAVVDQALDSSKVGIVLLIRRADAEKTPPPGT